MRGFLVKHKGIFMMMASALVMGIAVICPRLGFLQWFAMIPAAISLIGFAFDEDLRLRKIYGRTLLYFWVFYAIVFHWFIYMYPLDFVGLPKASAALVVVVACAGLSLLQALFSAAFFTVACAIVRRLKKYEWSKFVCPFVFAATYSAAELFQTVGWWGVPWGRLPLGQIESALFVRSASLFGSYFVTFVIVAVNFLLAQFILSQNKQKVFAVIALSIFTANLALGSLVTALYREEGEQVRAAALQGNISTTELWNSKMHDRTVDVYDRLTVLASSNGAQLIVWPETVFPYDLSREYQLKSYIKDLAKDNNVTLIASSYMRKYNSERCYNALFEVKSDGSIGDKMYFKQHLVPFGEYLPMRDLISFIIPPLAELNVLAEDLIPGDESTVIETDVGNIGFALCFDSIFEHVVRKACLNGAELIVISTNDSWFSGSAALEMHNSQARLRAIESGRYIVRAANTGVSSIIDPLGNVVERLEEGNEDYIISDVYLRETNTLYTYIGNSFVYLCVAFLIACGIIPLFRGKQEE